MTESRTPIQNVKIKVGLAALCADWFRQRGLQPEPGSPASTLDRDYERMTEVLGPCFDEVVAPGVICTVDDAARAAVAFREAGVDALLVVHLMWSEDQPLLKLLQECTGLPILLWNYHPTGALPARIAVADLLRLSGTVGILQGSAPMQRLGLAPHIISGAPGDSELENALREYATALRIRQEFAGMAAGRIAGRCEVMTGTFVDASSLLERLGVRLVEISAREYAATCEAVAPARIDAMHAGLVERFPVDGVSESALSLACRNALALDDLVLEHDLKAVAIQDLDEELHSLAGIRPCLCPPVSAERGVPFAMESDLNTALGMLVAMRTVAAPCMYTEIFTFDPVENVLLMGHAGVVDPRLAAASGVTIVPDAEYRHSDKCEGAWQQLILAPGPVTCISLYDAGSKYRMTVFEGESLGGACRLEGFAHALVRPDIPVYDLVAKLVQRGMTQHFAVAPGHISGVLSKWCKLSEVEFCAIPAIE